MDKPQDTAEGRRAVAEALAAGSVPDKLYYLSSGEGLGTLLDAARAAGARLVPCERTTLDSLSRTGRHQGVIAVLPPFRYAAVDEIFDVSARCGEAPFLVVCDGIQDERNLGAILRCAEAAGVHGVVIPKNRAAAVTPIAVRASAGAASHLAVARVPGIPAFLRSVKERNVWVYGADADGSVSIFDADFSGGVALVVGAEGRGLARLTAECCDALVSIPMRGRVASLNVSAAAALMCYQVVRSRR